MTGPSGDIPYPISVLGSWCVVLLSVAVPDNDTNRQGRGPQSICQSHHKMTVIQIRWINQCCCQTQVVDWLITPTQANGMAL